MTHGNHHHYFWLNYNRADINIVFNTRLDSSRIIYTPFENSYVWENIQMWNDCSGFPGIWRKKNSNSKLKEKYNFLKQTFWTRPQSWWKSLQDIPNFSPSGSILSVFWQSLDSRRVDSVFLNMVKKLQYKQKNLDKNTRGFVTGSKKAKKKKSQMAPDKN